MIDLLARLPIDVLEELPIEHVIDLLAELPIVGPLVVDAVAQAPQWLLPFLMGPSA